MNDRQGSVEKLNWEVSDGLRSARNRIRGAVSNTVVGIQLDGKKVDHDEPVVKLRTAITEARDLLAPAQFSEFINWIANQRTKQSIKVSDIVQDIRHIAGIQASNRVSLSDEIEWASLRLGLSLDLLDKYTNLLPALERAIGSDRELAEQLIIEVEAQLGQSIWLTELRIGVTQIFHGLEAQKHLARLLASRVNKGIVRHLIFQISVRNEPSVNPATFAREYRERLRRFRKFKPFMRTYFLYRIACVVPASQRGLAELLRAEQTHSPIDLYETLIAVLQQLVATDKRGNWRGPVLRALSRLKINDARIEKLKAYCGEDQVTLPFRSAKDLNLVLDGEGRRVICCALKRGRRSAGNVVEALPAAIALASGSRVSLRRRVADQSGVLERLASVLRKDSNFERASSDLYKMSQSLRGLASSQLLGHFIDLESRPRLAQDDVVRKLIALNDTHWDLSEAELIGSSVRINIISESLVEQASTPAKILWLRDGVEGYSSSTGAEIDALLRALQYYRRGDFARAIQLAEGILDASNRLVRVHAIQTLLDAQIKQGDTSRAIEGIVRICLSEPQLISVLPIVEIFPTSEWKRIAPYSTDISLPILMDLRFRLTASDRDATLRGFSLQQFLSSNNLERPSEMEISGDRFPNDEMIYLLRYLAVPSIMDMIQTFSTSQSLDDERVAVCALLSKIDPENAELYQSEVLVITNKRILTEGLQLVDSSRIHVDFDGITRRARIELSQLFDRYRELAKAGLNGSKDIEKAIKALLKSAKEEFSSFDNLDNEAETLLLDLVNHLRELFLFDPSHGLDSYLSKRVRHGSLPGYLRSPVEESQLITQRSSTDGPYRRNEHWLKKLTSLTTHQQVLVSDAFLKFAQDFDSEVLKLRDEIFHVRSTERPNGMFTVPLSVATVHLIRTLLDEEEDLGVFIELCLHTFWPGLEPSLAKVRAYLSSECAARMTRIFDRLRTNIHSIASQDPSFSALAIAIRGASSRVQNELDKVAQWLRRPEAHAITFYYTLEQAIEIALTSVLAEYKFAPRIEKKLPASCLVPGLTLISFADILRVVIGNVWKHSESGREPAVSVEITLDAEAGHLRFLIESEVARNVQTPECEEKLDAIRTAIGDGTIRIRERTEGGSGMAKLASLAASTSVEHFSFGFTAIGRFFIDLKFPFQEPP